MADHPKPPTFAQRIRAARPRDRRYAVRDDAIPGLMLRVHPGGESIFVIERRVRRRWRYATIGPADSVTVPEARREARQIIAGFLDTPEEIARVNTVLTRDEFYCPHVVAVIRLLPLTSCRVGEVLSLEWDWIKRKRILLPDSKSGPRTVWLSSAARAVIDAIPRYSADCPYLFPGRPPTRPIGNIGTHLDRIRRKAGLSDVRLHDCRHSWASVAAMNGVDMVTIAKLLGHALIDTTERYTHLSERSVVDTANRVSNRIHAALAGRGAGNGGGKAMPRVELAARLARDTGPGEKETFLFDKSLSSFGLRIHPSGRKVWIVQARIDGRTRRIVIARHGAWRSPPPRPRPARAHPGGREPGGGHQEGKGSPDVQGVRRDVSPPLRSALETIGAQDRAHL